jgi:unsaturated rhamnogalacturonyl hydrolase
VVNGSSLAYQWRFNETNLIEGNGISGSKSINLKLSGLRLTQSGLYSVVVTNVAGAVTSAVANLVVQRVISVTEALDWAGVAWKTSGSQGWFGQTNITHDGEDAAQSGPISDGKSIYFTTNITGPGTLSFWWKVSSETNNDVLLLQIGSVEKARISGEVDWVQAGPFAVPSGSQALKWIYRKNSSVTSGADAGWVDQVLFVPPAPEITSQPASQTVLSDSAATFAVGASGAGLSYQWYWDGLALSNNAAASGVNTGNLVLPAAATNQSGGYSVVITNFGGAVTSAVALLEVHYDTNNVLPGTNEIAAAILLANDYFIRNNTRQTNGWSRGVYQAGNARAYQVLGTQRFYDWAVQWGDYFRWQPGWRGPTNADGEVCGQAYVDLYKVDPQPIRIAALKAGMDNRVAYVPVDDWWWIDAFFMAGPVYARFGNLYQTNSYFDKLFAMYQDMKVRRGLYDPTEGLWYRDADAKIAKTANGKKQFWGRGEGWVIAACARILEQSPTSATQQAEYATMLQRMAAVLKPRQGSDGFWRASIYDPAEVPNPETSATALFTYAMAWGIRNGYLDAAEYGPVVARAWNGMVRIALHPDGKLGYVQPQGKFPDKAGYEDTADHGVGPFLLAGSEVMLLSTATPSVTTTPVPASGVGESGLAELQILQGKGSFILRWKTRPGANYQVLWTDDLLLGDWAPLDGEMEFREGEAWISVGAEDEAQHFFRIEER